MVMSLKTLRHLQARALRAGATRHSITTVEWDISGSCQRPGTRELVAHEYARYDKANSNWSRSRGFARLILHTRCRKCEMCLRLKSYEWRNKITFECREAPRTWFVTFTLSPQEHNLAWLRSVQRLRKSGWDPREIDVTREFKERSREFGFLLTKFFKRLRKNSGRTFRYVLVVEPHKSGLPHFHALIHDSTGKLTYRDITGEWTHLGFAGCKLIDLTPEKAPAYITKYVMKYSLARIRASLHYGSRA